MADITYGKATAKDYEDLVDFGNYVFSHAHGPLDSPSLVPKLYKRERFVPENHYVVWEGGRVKANIGAYPMTYRVCGETVKTFGIGWVAVHPYSRSKGYMKLLMNEIDADMRSMGMELGCLGGQRQRYEYFGFAKCGAQFVFSFNKVNIRHAFGSRYASGIVIKEVTEGDGAELDWIHRAHCGKEAYVERPRPELHEIMSSWRNRTLAVYKGDEMIGYLGVSNDYSFIQESCVKDLSLTNEIIGLYLAQYDIGGVRIKAFPHERQKIDVISRTAESYELTDSYNFNVMDYPGVIKKFAKLKASPAPDGKVVVKVGDSQNVKISAKGGVVDACETTEEPDYIVSHLEAMKCFFSPVFFYAGGALYQNAFARGLFPIPLYIENNDDV